MLKWRLFKWSYTRYILSGLFVDFFIKKCVEVYIKNFLIYGAQFFAEKYMIEHLTKKIFNFSINLWNTSFSINSLSYYYYFIQLLSVVLYVNILLNILAFI